MHWSSEPGVCDGDYYCNPSASCGVSCAELALFEANRHAFKTRAHSAMGPVGLGARARVEPTSGHQEGLVADTHGAPRVASPENGLGGKHSAFSADEYGPGRPVIDTLRPFTVHAHFATDGSELTDIEITLAQDDKDGELRWTSSLTGQSYSIPLLRSSADEE